MIPEGYYYFGKFAKANRSFGGAVTRVAIQRDVSPETAPLSRERSHGAN
jgi:hypothetical protein